MAFQLSLNELVEALAGAIIEAQDRIERHQISNLARYFDEDNRPLSVNIRLPSLHPQAETGDEETYRAPYLALVSANLLKIKDVELSFDVDLVEIGEPAPGGAAAAAPPVSPPVKGSVQAAQATRAPTRNVQIDMRAGFLRRRAGAVHVVLRVEGSEPAEGAARLVNHLVQTQGVVGPIIRAE
jgi:hypothetical protein